MEYAYVGTAPCGCTGYASMDEPQYAKENAKEVARLIRKGWTVERKPSPVAVSGCSHKPKWGER